MLKNILLVLLGTALISISAQLPLQLPLIATDIPGTWQTFAVLIFAACTNRWIGSLAVILYLVIGGLGLPVFADGNSGWEILAGNSGGYLYGFVIGAFVVGWLQELNWHSFLRKSLLSMLIGTAIILSVGTLHLASLIGFEKAWLYGVYPFLLGALIKIILGAFGGLWLF